MGYVRAVEESWRLLVVLQRKVVETHHAAQQVENMLVHT